MFTWKPTIAIASIKGSPDTLSEFLSAVYGGQFCVHSAHTHKYQPEKDLLLYWCTFMLYRIWPIHITYSWNIKWQKCARMGLNGFILQKINYANTYSHYLQLKYQVAKMRRHFCFLGPFYILIFIYLLKYKTIETHARAFLPLNVSAVDSVY